MPCSLQKLLIKCEQFGLSNCITFIPLKSMYVIFRPKKNHSFIPNMIFNSTVLLLKCDIKYLGFMPKTSLSDNEAILKELRTLFIRSNVILRNVILM